jgi:hypothetical protein
VAIQHKLKLLIYSGLPATGLHAQRLLFLPSKAHMRLQRQQGHHTSGPMQRIRLFTEKGSA